MTWEMKVQHSCGETNASSKALAIMDCSVRSTVII